MHPIIGIDLGTTNSLCAIFENGRPRLIPNVHGQELTPSAVALTEDGEVLVGAAAIEMRVTRPERCAWAFKRLMGTERRVEIGEQVFTAPELSSFVLKSLKEDAQADLRTEVHEAVITVPAYFNEHQRKATQAAGRMAGLNVRRIINEPTAAALTYGFHDREAEKKLIVIDLGGGTFDVTAMEVFEGTLEIISTAGESFLGGEDFTDRLVGRSLETLGLQLETAELQHPLLVSRLRQECEAAKRRLFDCEEATIRIPAEKGELSDERPTVSLGRAEFADLVDPLVKRLARPIAKAVRDSRCPVEEFADVVLVGGATRMQVVREFIPEFFGLDRQDEEERSAAIGGQGRGDAVPSASAGLLCTFDPDEVVALGAAVQAALIQDDRAVDDMVVTDVCPFTLGVEVAKTFGRRHMEGYYLPVIHRNTTIPVSREELVATLEPNQREVTVRVYQGEARKVQDNLFLGELHVSGIPPGPSGQPIHLRFTYDINGVLEVEAYVPETGKKFTTVLTQHADGLSKKEIDAAVRKLQAVKFYPRDDVRNRHLVLFAERVIGEVSPYERDELEAAVDAFETAMASGDREWFEHSRQGLLTMLSALGFPYDDERTAFPDDSR